MDINAYYSALLNSNNVKFINNINYFYTLKPEISLINLKLRSYLFNNTDFLFKNNSLCKIIFFIYFIYLFF